MVKGTTAKTDRLDFKMASSHEQRLIIVTIVACFLVGLGSTLRIETTPEPFSPLIHNQINISCTEGDAANGVQVVMIELGRQEGGPIAVIHSKSGTTLAPNASHNVQAVGAFNEDRSQGVLTMIINNPGMDDAGIYNCRMFYIDEVKQINRETVVVNATVDNNLTFVVTHLAEKISALEQTTKDDDVFTIGNQLELLIGLIARQNQTIKGQGRQIKSQENQINRMNDLIINLNDTIKSQSHQIKSQKNQIESQDQKIESQEHQIRSHEDQMYLMDELIKCQRDEIKGHDLIIRSQGHNITSLETAITREINNLASKDQDNTAIVSNLQATVARMSGSFSQLGDYVTQQMEKDTTQCAFSVGYDDKNIKIYKHRVMMFTRTITNIGNHFNIRTGTFTAPRKGIYVFYLFAMTRSDKDIIDIKLLVNNRGRSVAGLYAEDADNSVGDQSSVSSVLSLDQGDRVYPWVSDYKGQDILWAGHYSVFSGYLLKAL